MASRLPIQNTPKGEKKTPQSALSIHLKTKENSESEAAIRQTEATAPKKEFSKDSIPDSEQKSNTFSENSSKSSSMGYSLTRRYARFAAYANPIRYAEVASSPRISPTKRKKPVSQKANGFLWGEIWDSNPRPPGPQPGAITNLANPTV